MAVRPATVEDAAQLGPLQLRAWWRAYADIVDPHLLMEWDEESRAAHWSEILAAGEPTRTLVAEIAGSIRGFVSVGPSREDPGEPSVGEVWALYVDPAAQGAGLGGVLLAAGEDALRAAGHTSAVLGVLEENGLARAFYARHGWTLVPGSESSHPWGGHVLYRRTL